MKTRWVFILCAFGCVSGCELDNKLTLNCSGLNLTRIWELEDLQYFNETFADIINLNLSFNSLTNPISFTNWSNSSLEILDISHNELTEVNTDTFAVLTNLKVLDLSNNRLLGVSLVWSRLPRMRYLDISNNPSIKNNLDIFTDISNSSVTNLNLSSTNLHLPSVSAFSKASSLISLDLSRNGLDYIPYLPANLEYLDFSNNSIIHIVPDCFVKDTRLMTLLLEHNAFLLDIRYDSFNYLSELRNLSFEGCSKVSHLPTSLFFFNERLEFLSLAHCNFQNISVTFKSSFLAMKSVDLRDNPWHCGSHIKWFVQLHDHNILNENVRCATPENVSIAEYLGPKVRHKVVRILLTILSVVLFCVLITVIAISCNMENKRRKTLNSYSPLEKSSKPYRGSMIYVTTSV